MLHVGERVERSVGFLFLLPFGFETVYWEKSIHFDTVLFLLLWLKKTLNKSIFHKLKWVNCNCNFDACFSVCPKLFV